MSTNLYRNLPLVFGQVSSEEPVSWKGAGDVKHPGGPIGQSPCQGDGKRSRDDGIPGKPSVEGVDYRRSSRSEISVDRETKKHPLNTPQGQPHYHPEPSF